ncbi:50S ribosomal protein L24e [Nanoarchaeota archaeon]
MARCSFCEKTIKPGTGKIYVKKTGKIFNFCTMKCEKNLFKLKRKPATTVWTKTFQKEKEGKK